MTVAIRDKEDLLGIFEHDPKNLYVIAKDRQRDEISAYSRGLETFSSNYLHVVGVEKLLRDVYRNNTNILYINGNFAPYIFSSKVTDSNPIYVAGLVAFPSYIDNSDFPQPPQSGVFVGFAGDIQIDRFTQSPYGVPHTFGVISFPAIAEVPYAWHTRVTGKTSAAMGAKNLRLVPEINPRFQGVGGLDELQDYLLANTTIEEARDVIQRGLQKNVVNNKISHRRRQRKLPGL